MMIFGVLFQAEVLTLSGFGAAFRVGRFLIRRIISATLTSARSSNVVNVILFLVGKSESNSLLRVLSSKVSPDKISEVYL